MKLNIIEQNVTTILRPTGINLAPFVINPYQGCEFGCLFCYAQFNKAALNSKKKWGSYVKVKVNAVEILEKEIDLIKPKKVLLGSTTECFQTIEKKYKITEAILRILNKRKINYIILTRSLLIGDYISLLDRTLCNAIYFTVDTLPLKLRQGFQVHIPEPGQSIEMINKLNAQNINTIAYFSPVMPYLFDARDLICNLDNVSQAEFEIMNFKMAASRQIIEGIKQLYPEYANAYERLIRDKGFFEKTINELEDEIKQKAAGYLKNVTVHSHGYEDYFNNVYADGYKGKG